MFPIFRVRSFPIPTWGAVALVVGVLTALPGARAAGFSWQGVADAVGQKLEAAISEYRNGDEKEAKRALTEAYFGVFEGRKFEAAMRKTLGQTHAFEVERKFGNLRRLIGKKPVGDLEAAVADLMQRLRADATTLDEKGVPEEVYDAR